MAKLLLLSTVLMSLFVPVAFASDRSAKRGMARTIRMMICYNVFYVIAVFKIYPHLSH